MARQPCCDICQEDYPKSVFFIITTEFCERFSYYGLRTILILYLTSRINLDDDDATGLFHAFSALCYFSPILGAIIADGYIGKFKTILSLGFVFAVGQLILSLTAIPPQHLAGPLIGLLLIALGTGGIKPCVSAFGGDQFPVEQVARVTGFYSVFYFSINLGSAIATAVIPVVRSGVQCFGEDCYLLAFGIPCMLMLTALVIYLLGTRYYKKYPPTENVIGKAIRATCYALTNRCKKSSSDAPKQRWVDYADDKYSAEFLNDLSRLGSVLFLYVPLPVFWALFNQQGSRWVLQARHMNGYLGSLGTILPDQIQVINPILILISIPLFDNCLYPLLNTCNLLRRPLQRMVCGMVLAVFAFLAAGFINLAIEAEDIQAVGSGSSSVALINEMSCDIRLSSNNPRLDQFFLGRMQNVEIMTIDSGEWTVDWACEGNSQKKQSKIIAESEKHFAAVFYHDSADLALTMIEYPSLRPTGGKALIITLSTFPTQLARSSWVVYKSTDGDHHYEVYFNTSQPYTSLTCAAPEQFTAYLHREGKDPISLLSTGTFAAVGVGGIYTNVLRGNTSSIEWLNVHEVVPGVTVSILWQILPYLLITFGEIMFSVTGLAFSYSQAPKTMKSVVQAAWLFNTAVGDIVVMLVAESRIFKHQSNEFFLFAVLMAITTVIFAVMSKFYKYVGEDEYEPIETDKAPLTTNEDYNSSEDVPLRLTSSGFQDDNNGAINTTDS